MTDHGRPDGAQNIGAMNTGAGSQYVELAIGQQNTYPAAAPAPGVGHGRGRADIGVITVLSQELRAVVGVLERTGTYRTRQLYGGVQAHEAEVPVGGRKLRTVALQSLDRGPRSAVVAYQFLRQHYAPPLILLVGIAGGIGSGVAVGDVVVSDEVIYYDARRDTALGERRRGRSYLVAPVLRHRLNEFFRVHGGTARDRGGGSFGVHRGPVGSGDVVVTDRDSGLRRWLHEVHEKTLAVETEAGGIAQAFYEEVAHDTALRGWLTIRGISDLADATKGYADHEQAAERAAVVFEGLLPFLLLTGADG
jgi:adenosylhomocysteine nucleosidase